MHRSSVKLGIVVLVAAMFVSACGSVQSLLGPDDKAIISDIQSKLFQDSVLKTRDIRVTSTKGVVVLTGSVQTELEKAGAERLASQASGVKQVQNQLGVATDTAAQVDSPATPVRVDSPATTAKEEALREEPAAPIRVRPTPRAKAKTAVKREHHAVEARNAAASTEEDTTPPQIAQATSTPVETHTTPPPPPPPPPPVQITIPAGTVITVRMIDDVDSSRDQAGQDFGASVAAPVAVDDRVIIPQGSDAMVRLVKAKNAGHMSGQSEVELELTSVTVAGTRYDAVTTTYNKAGASRGTRTAETVGGGAVLGGLIGAIAGHGKGAAIGSVIGAGAGTAAQAGTKAPPMKIAPETKIDFTLRAPITVTLPPGRSSSGDSR